MICGLAKGYLLVCKTYAFALQKVWYCKAKAYVWISEGKTSELVDDVFHLFAKANGVAL